MKVIPMVIVLLGMATLADAEMKRALSGEYEYGEKFTAVYVDPENSDDARDDEDFDEYSYKNAWLQLDQPLRPGNSVSVRTQQLDRRYVSRPVLDNTTRNAKIRFSLEPHDNWALWPHVSFRRRDYDARTLDNDIIVAGVETRYRWGIRNNVRVGASYTRVEYDQEQNRDRESGGAFVSVERPINSALTLRVGGRVDETRFRIPSSSRENSTRGSASVGFRCEF